MNSNIDPPAHGLYLYLVFAYFCGDRPTVTLSVSISNDLGPNTIKHLNMVLNLCMLPLKRVSNNWNILCDMQTGLWFSVLIPTLFILDCIRKTNRNRNLLKQTNIDLPPTQMAKEIALRLLPRKGGSIELTWQRATANIVAVSYTQGLPLSHEAFWQKYAPLTLLFLFAFELAHSAASKIKSLGYTYFKHLKYRMFSMAQTWF